MVSLNPPYNALKMYMYNRKNHGVRGEKQDSQSEALRHGRQETQRWLTSRFPRSGARARGCGTPGGRPSPRGVPATAGAQPGFALGLLPGAGAEARRMLGAGGLCPVRSLPPACSGDWAMWAERHLGRKDQSPHLWPWGS